MFKNKIYYVLCLSLVTSFIWTMEQENKNGFMFNLHAIVHLSDTEKKPSIYDKNLDAQRATNAAVCILLGHELDTKNDHNETAFEVAEKNKDILPCTFKVMELGRQYHQAMHANDGSEITKLMGLSHYLDPINTVLFLHFSRINDKK